MRATRSSHAGISVQKENLPVSFWAVLATKLALELAPNEPSICREIGTMPLWEQQGATTLFRYGLDDALRCHGWNDPGELVTGGIEQSTKLSLGPLPSPVHH
jgi:hypothetical protein